MYGRLCIGCVQVLTISLSLDFGVCEGPGTSPHRYQRMTPWNSIPNFLKEFSMLGHFLEVLWCVLIHDIFAFYSIDTFGFVLIETGFKLQPSKNF